MNTFHVGRNTNTLFFCNEINIKYAINQQEKTHGYFKLKISSLYENEEKTFFVWKELILK